MRASRRTSNERALRVLRLQHPALRARLPGSALDVAVLTYPPGTVRCMWLHSSPNWIAPGAWVLPPAIRGIVPRTFPAGDAADAVRAGWNDDNRVYVVW